MVTGASRLVAGTLQLLLLAFGIIGAAQVVGLPPPDDVVGRAGRTRSAPGRRWLGVLLVGVGSYLYHSAPRRSLGWLCLVLYAGWIGQYLGNQICGSYLSGFVGAIVMTPMAYLVERLPSGPPALVSFLPAFWLLVPGALSLIGHHRVPGPRRRSAGSRTSSARWARWSRSRWASSADIRSTAPWSGRSSRLADVRPR